MKLKNGTEEDKALVAATMLTARLLLDSNPMAFHDAVMIARDPKYRPFGNLGKTLAGARILQDDGAMHASIRNVLLSAVTGDGLAMVLGSPGAP